MLDSATEKNTPVQAVVSSDAPTPQDSSEKKILAKETKESLEEASLCNSESARQHPTGTLHHRPVWSVWILEFLNCILAIVCLLSMFNTLVQHTE
jgi:hypothetical protein